MKLISVNECGDLGLIEYVGGKAKRNYPNGDYDALYTKEDSFIFETKQGGETKRIRIPSNMYFSLVELIPALNYFDDTLYGDTALIDGDEILSFKNRRERGL
jgi:hypothetical protein